ncbi:MAG: UDP-N-acetylglucosamine pyrophosphorylase [Clostridia bacterium]|nr:UDP-N-acetylglucosamine pyrophosphorylase [Clostridia bacterium]
MYKTKELYNLEKSLAGEYLSQFEYPWHALSGIKELILSLGKELSKNEYNEISENVWVHKSVKIAPTAYIGAPCIIGKDTEVRQCAFIRSAALIGEDCVIGNSTEVKNAIIFDSVQVPHFNYVGDSILGYKSHLGAGAVTSNVKSDRSLVAVKTADGRIETGLKKFGAMVGDNVEVGCNSVLNPGTVIGRNSNIYPLSSVRGSVPENSIFKNQQNIILKENCDG